MIQTWKQSDKQGIVPSSRQIISVCSISFSAVNLVLHIYGTIKSNSVASFAMMIKLRQAAILDNKTCCKSKTR